MADEVSGNRGILRLQLVYAFCWVADHADGPFRRFQQPNVKIASTAHKLLLPVEVYLEPIIGSPLQHQRILHAGRHRRYHKLHCVSSKELMTGEQRDTILSSGILCCFHFASGLSLQLVGARDEDAPLRGNHQTWAGHRLGRGSLLRPGALLAVDTAVAGTGVVSFD